jgi:hypothetical protein
MHEAPMPDVPPCWECETLTGDLTEAVLPVSNHHVISVRLCAACYRDTYLSLAADAEDTRVPTTR